MSTEALLTKIGDVQKSLDSQKKTYADDKSKTEADIKAFAENVKAIEKGLADLAASVKGQEHRPKEAREIHGQLGRGVIATAQLENRLDKAILDEEELKAYTATTDEGGGALVDHEVMSGIRSIQTEYGWARRNVTMLPMGTSSVSFVEEQTDVYDVHENIADGATLGTPPAANDPAKLKTVKLNAGKDLYYGSVPTELLEEANIAEPLGAWLMPQIARRFSYLEDLRLANLLLTSTLITNIYYLGGISTSGATAFTDLSVGDLVNGGAAVEIAAPNSKWHLNRQPVASAFTEKDSQGAFVYRSDLMDLLGIELAEIMPGWAGTAVDTAFGIYGNLERAVYAGELRRLNFKTTDAHNFPADVVSILATQRTGFALSEAGAKTLVRLKSAAS